MGNVTPISYLGGVLPYASSPISSRNVVGSEAAHQEKRRPGLFWMVVKGWVEVESE
jgi:hypothetical protein